MSKIYIIGGANIDIHGIPETKVKMKDSNPGDIVYSYGGVARNIAENICRINNKNEVVFVSAIGNDVYGKKMYEDCLLLNMNMDYTIRTDEYGTSTYLAILDSDQDMLVAIADMKILDLLSDDYLHKVVNEINEDDIVVLDTNLNQETISYFLSKVNAKVYCDPISAAKAMKIKEHISKIYMIKPNKLEAEIISGIKINGPEDYVNILNYFVDKGCKEVIVTLGKEGVIATNSKEYLHITHPYLPIVNATGAGDSFLGAYIDSKKENMDFYSRVVYAISASMITISSVDTVCPKISKENILKQKNMIKFKGENLC